MATHRIPAYFIFLKSAHNGKIVHISYNPNDGFNEDIIGIDSNLEYLW